jgi:hypothetical protein
MKKKNTFFACLPCAAPRAYVGFRASLLLATHSFAARFHSFRPCNKSSIKYIDTRSSDKSVISNNPLNVTGAAPGREGMGGGQLFTRKRSGNNPADNDEKPCRSKWRTTEKCWLNNMF